MPGGRPAWEPTEKDIRQVEILAGQGLEAEMIANCLGISRDTYYERIKDNKQFSDAIKKGQGQAAAFVTGKLFNQIRKDNLTAIIFYLKTRLRWKEPSNDDFSKESSETENKSKAKELLRDVVQKAKKNLNNKDGKK